MKKNHFKICNLNIFYISLHCKLIIFKIDWYMEKGLELQKQFYIEDSLLFDELIEENNKEGGNNG